MLLSPIATVTGLSCIDFQADSLRYSVPAHLPPAAIMAASLARPLALQWALAEGVSPILKVASLKKVSLLIPLRGVGAPAVVWLPSIGIRRIILPRIWKILCSILLRNFGFKLSLNWKPVPRGVTSEMRFNSASRTPMMTSASSGSLISSRRNSPMVRPAGSTRRKISLTIQPLVMAWYSRLLPAACCLLPCGTSGNGLQ